MLEPIADGIKNVINKFILRKTILMLIHMFVTDWQTKERIYINIYKINSEDWKFKQNLSHHYVMGNDKFISLLTFWNKKVKLSIYEFSFLNYDINVYLGR